MWPTVRESRAWRACRDGAAAEWVVWLARLFELFFVFTLPFTIAPVTGPWMVPVAAFCALGSLGLDPGAPATERGQPIVAPAHALAAQSTHRNAGL